MPSLRLDDQWVSVETETGGSGVLFDQGRCGSIAYSQGHQSHQVAAGKVALAAPLAGCTGVAVMRSFTATVVAVSNGGRTAEPAAEPVLGLVTAQQRL